MTPASQRYEIFQTVPCADLDAFHTEGTFRETTLSAIGSALSGSGFAVTALRTNRSLVATRASVLFIVGANLEFTLTRVPQQHQIKEMLCEIAGQLVEKKV
jgi:hypothetical protein